jgi:hypothetical protein
MHHLYTAASFKIIVLICVTKGNQDAGTRTTRRLFPSDHEYGVHDRLHYHWPHLAGFLRIYDVNVISPHQGMTHP